MIARIPCALALALLAAVPAAAQERKHLTLVGVPAATVAPAGTAFASLSGTNRSFNGLVDGSLALGMGFGNAEETVGVQVTAQITSLTDDFADSGYIQFKLARRLGSRPIYAGLQVDHLLNWGDSAFVPTSAKAMVTWFGSVQAGGELYPVMATVGVGDRIRNLGQDPGAFAGIGIGLSPVTAVSAAFSGDYFDVGVGLRVDDRLAVTLTANDVFDMRDRRRLTVSATYSFQNLFGGRP